MVSSGVLSLKSGDIEPVRVASAAKDVGDIGVGDEW
jgi:hypothetical protein